MIKTTKLETESKTKNEEVMLKFDGKHMGMPTSLTALSLDFSGDIAFVALLE